MNFCPECGIECDGLPIAYSNGELILLGNHNVDGVECLKRQVIQKAYQLAAKSAECEKLRDDPEADCTDAAHPAWWRGHEHTAYSMCQLINEILDGKDDGRGVANEPWESTRRRLIQLAAKSAECEKMREACEFTLDWLSSFSMPPTSIFAEKQYAMKALAAALSRAEGGSDE